MQREYLDNHVSSERTMFAIPEEPLADGQSDALLRVEVTFKGLRARTLEAAQSDLGPLLREIERFIDQEAPQYRLLETLVILRRFVHFRALVTMLSVGKGSA